MRRVHALLPDLAAIAVGDTRGAEEMYETVRWAKRLEQSRFIEIPTAGIRCYNEGYGECPGVSAIMTGFP